MAGQQYDMFDLNEMFEMTLEEFIDSRRMFTGYDVTRVTRERERIKLRHRDVAADIHKIQLLQEAVDDGDYQLHSITTPQGDQVILYCPREGNPNEYQFDSNPQLDPVQALSAEHLPSTDFILLPSAVPSVVADPLPSTTSQLWDNHKASNSAMAFDSDDEHADTAKNGEYSLDFRNRLQVPFIRLMSLAVKKDTEVYLLPNLTEETLTISSVSLDPMREVKAMVDKDGVLVSSKVLRGAGFSGNLYQINNATLDGKKVIVVSEKK
jgi:hypothetical protein